LGILHTHLPVGDSTGNRTVRLPSSTGARVAIFCELLRLSAGI
jgi:hypothetical protein